MIWDFSSPPHTNLNEPPRLRGRSPLRSPLGDRPLVRSRSKSHSPVGNKPDFFDDLYDPMFAPIPPTENASTDVPSLSLLSQTPSIPPTENASTDDQEARSSYTQDEPPAHGQTDDQLYYNQQGESYYPQQGYDQQTESSSQQDKTFLQGQTSPQISAKILATLKNIHPGLSEMCEFELNEKAPKILNKTQYETRKSFTTPRFDTEKEWMEKAGLSRYYLSNKPLQTKSIPDPGKRKLLLADWFAINNIEEQVTQEDEKNLERCTTPKNNPALHTIVYKYFKAMNDGLQDVIKSKEGY